MKSLMFSSVVLGAFLGLSACAFGTVTLPDTCTTQDVDWGSPTLVNGPNTIGPAAVKADLSGALNKLKSVTKNMTVSVSKIWIDNPGNLSWISSASVSIQGGASDGSTPNVLLGTFTGSAASMTTIPITVSMDEATLVKYMESGTVILTYEVSGNVTQSNKPPVGVLKNNVGLCVNTTGDFSL